MKAYEKIGILLHQSHCSVVPKNTVLLFPNLLHFIFPKSLYFFFLFTQGSRSKSKNRDELMNYTVRVMGQAFFICLVTRKLSRWTNIVFIC